MEINKDKMAKQLTLGFDKRVFDFRKYPCADVAMVPACYFPQKSSDSYKPVEDCLIEVLISDLTKPIINPGKVPKNWDLRKMDLTHFNKNTLEDIYYGTWNLWVPTEMLDIVNPAEFVGNCLAAGILKRYNGHKANEQIPKGSFSELVKYMNRVAYSNPVFAANSRNFKRRFSANPGDQEKRLGDLSGEVKRDFCRSFWRDYRASKDEQPNDPDAFYDPISRQGYIDRIYSHFKRRYEKEHPKL